MSYLDRFLHWCCGKQISDLEEARREKVTLLSNLRQHVSELSLSASAQRHVAEQTHKGTRDAIHDVRNFNQVLAAKAREDALAALVAGMREGARGDGE